MIDHMYSFTGASLVLMILLKAVKFLKWHFFWILSFVTGCNFIIITNHCKYNLSITQKENVFEKFL